MTDSLKSLFEAIAKRYGIFMLDRLPDFSKKSPLLKLAVSLEHNPILRYLIEHHAPIHEEALLPKGKWQTICPRFDHGHVMAAPIVNDGSLVGVLGVTRDRHSEPFNSQNIADISALSLHLSICLVKIKLRSKEVISARSNSITPREKQIAELVARGYTNAEIAKSIWITENSVKQALKRMFRKLNVSSRAQMIGKLTGIVSI